MISIAITTAPRPKETLTASVSSLRVAGFTENIHVFSDREIEDISDCTIHRNRPPLGGLKNWCHALEWVVNNTVSPWILMLEDDILWAKDSAVELKAELAQLNPAKIGYISLYLSNKTAQSIENFLAVEKLERGLHVAPVSYKCWGSQAYLIPRRSAQRLLVDPEFINKRNNHTKNRNRDTIVSGCLRSMNLDLLFRVPSLVNHELGWHNSALGNKVIHKELQTKYWTGQP